MPTSKKRLTVTLSKDVSVFLKKIAVRDNVPEATKAAELLEKALEIEEDEYFSTIADKRASDKNADAISHEEFWKSVT